MSGTITSRIADDISFITDPVHDAAARKSYLDGRPTVRVISRKGGKYDAMYAGIFHDSFRANISSWQAALAAQGINRPERARRKAELAGYLPDLTRLYAMNLMDGKAMGHEEILRGGANDGSAYVKGRGNLEQALAGIRRP